MQMKSQFRLKNPILPRKVIMLQHLLSIFARLSVKWSLTGE